MRLPSGIVVDGRDARETVTQLSFATIDILARRAGPDPPEYELEEYNDSFFAYTTGLLPEGGYAAFVVPPGWTAEDAAGHEWWKVFETADLAKQQRDEWLASRLASDGLVALPPDGPTLETRVEECPKDNHRAVAADGDGKCLQCALPEDLEGEAGVLEVIVGFLKDGHDRGTAIDLARAVFS